MPITTLLISSLLFFQAAPSDAQIRSRASSYIRELHAAGKWNGSVLMLKRDRVLFEDTRGFANLEFKVQFRKDTKFRVHSLSKQYTGAAFMKLVEAGKLAPSDSPQKWFSEWPEAWQAVTLHHLLTHTSGLPVGEDDWVGKWSGGPAQTVEAGLKDWGAKPLLANPGEKWSYTNIGYEVLAAVMEKASGLSFPELMRSTVFAPLELADTLIDLPVGQKPYMGHRSWPSMATGYNDSFAAPKISPNRAFMIMGSGGVITSMRDLRKYVRALSTGKLLTAASWETMLKGELVDANSPSRYGYGWIVGERFGRKVIRHDGGTNGFLAHVQIFPAEDLTIITLTNFGFAYMRVAMDLGAIAFGQPVTMPKP